MEFDPKLPIAANLTKRYHSVNVQEEPQERDNPTKHLVECSRFRLITSTALVFLVVLLALSGQKSDRNIPNVPALSQKVILQSPSPLDALTQRQLRNWCNRINSVRGTTVNCWASKSQLIQDFQEVYGFYNLPKNVPWFNADAFIGVTPLSQFKHVNSDNLKMYYHLWPQGSGPRNTPVVMVGGWSAVKEDWIESATYWSQQAATQRTILAMDLRGAGQTGLGPTTGNYSGPQFAKDVADLIQQVFPNEQVFVIGGALGGKIALQMAVDHPHLIKAAIPCATVGGQNLTVLGPLRDSFIQIVLNGEQQSKPKQFAEAVYSPTWVANNPTKWVTLMQRGSKYNRPVEGSVRQYAIAEFFDISGEVGRINISTLCMHGSDDQIDLPESSQRLAAAIGSNAAYEELTGEGHAFWQMDAIEFVNDAEVFFEQRGLKN